MLRSVMVLATVFVALSMFTANSFGQQWNWEKVFDHCPACIAVGTQAVHYGPFKASGLGKLRIRMKWKDVPCKPVQKWLI